MQQNMVCYRLRIPSLKDISSIYQKFSKYPSTLTAKWYRIMKRYWESEWNYTIIFIYKVCVGFAIAPVTINLNINHNYNKILKSDWLSTVLNLTLIGQCNQQLFLEPEWALSQ